MDVLKIKNLTKSFNSFTLNDISFNLPKGSIMGLIGENGAGKTTTIKLILNLIKKDYGSIELFGLDNIENEMTVKEKMGIVLDESHFPDNLKARDVSYIMKNIYKNWDDNKFLDYINKFGLPLYKTIKDFSKGMKMKLSIAAALSHDPQLLILDEPTSGLDPVIRNELLDIFLEFIQDEEKSILFSTHITSDLDKIADYITFLHQGKLIFTESIYDISAKYGVIKCGLEDLNKIDKNEIVGYRKNKFGIEVLVNNKLNSKYREFAMDDATLEDIMLYHIRGEK